MLKLRNKLITVLAILASLLILSGGILMFNQTAIANQATIEPENQVTIETSYIVGQTMNVPNANVVVGGGSYPATSISMREPSGNIISVSGEFKFDKIGNYALIYSAVVNGKQVSVETKITVDNDYYSASKVTTVEKDTLSVVKNSQDKGIHVRIPYTDSFVWNTPVNLAETGLNTPLISFLPYQYSKEKVGEDGSTPNQADEIYVRLTDAYNKEVYVDVRLEYFLNNKAANQMPSYAAGAARNQIRALSENLGRDSREGVIMNVGDGRYFVTYPERGGYPYMGEITEDSSLISLFYDVNTNKVYVEQQVLAGERTLTLINDIDAPEVYGEDAFAGFTTGEVYVSLFVDHVVSKDGMVDIEIASIGNQSGEQLFKIDKAEDITPPTLKIDVTREQIDNGLFVAQGQDVKILDYDVKDVNFSGEKFSVKVLYNNETDITIKDGKFNAKDLGKYSVIYRAEDDFGNVSEQTLVYNCINRSANNNKLIEIDLVEYSGDKKAGSTITLPEVAISSLNNFVNKKVYALAEGSQTPIAIDFDNPELKLDKVGTYTIVYEYSDVFESGKTSYTITSEASDIVEIANPILPKYFIKGAKYTLDAVFAKTYDSASSQLQEVSYEVKFDDNAYVAVDNYADFEVTGNSTVTFKYSYGSATPLEVGPIQIIDVGFGDEETLDKSKYFVGDIVAQPYNVSGSTHGYMFKANKLGEASIDYIAPLSLDNFAVNFKIPNEAKNVKSVEFEITDYLNRNNVVTVVYANTGSGTSFEVLGKAKGATTKVFTESDLVLEYSSARALFLDNKLGLTAPWANTFESNKVLLKITLKGITGDAGIAISSLCGQVINNIQNDDVKPTISYKSDFKGAQKKGTEITIFPATGNDVLCPSYYAGGRLILIATKINKDGSRTTLKSVDGISLNRVDATREYKVVLDDIAEYQFNYQYSDQGPGLGGVANRGSSTYIITTIDDVKPTITIDGGLTEFDVVEGKLNTLHTAKSFTVSDNLDEEKDIRVNVVVIDPFFTMYDIVENAEKPIEIEDMKIELKYKGEYVVYYYAEDTSGNVASASYRIFVK